MKSSQNSPIQPEQEDWQIKRKKPSYSRSSKRNDFHSDTRFRNATDTQHKTFAWALQTSASGNDNLSSHQLLFCSPFLGAWPPNLLPFVFLFKCFQKCFLSL